MYLETLVQSTSHLFQLLLLYPFRCTTGPLKILIHKYDNIYHMSTINNITQSLLLLFSLLLLRIIDLSCQYQHQGIFDKTFRFSPKVCRTPYSLTTERSKHASRNCALESRIQARNALIPSSLHSHTPCSWYQQPKPTDSQRMVFKYS